MKGLYKKLAEKYTGGNISAVKKIVMKTIIEAAKELIKEAGITGKYGHAWQVAIRYAAKAFFDYVKTHNLELPDVATVVAYAKQLFPDCIQAIIAEYEKEFHSAPVAAPAAAPA